MIVSKKSSGCPQVQTDGFEALIAKYCYKSNVDVILLQNLITINLYPATSEKVTWKLKKSAQNSACAKNAFQTTTMCPKTPFQNFAKLWS